MRTACSLTASSGRQPWVAADVIRRTLPSVGERGEGGDEIAAVALDVGGTGARECGEVVLCQGLKGRIVAGADDLTLGERDPAFEVALVTRLQQRISEHVEERCESDIVTRYGTAIGREPLEGREQGQIGLGDRLEEPLFLEEGAVFRMAHPREMGVEDEARRPPHLPSRFASGRGRVVG